MIPQIEEIGFGPGTAKAYATLHQATVSFQEMGERTISTQVRIDGDVVPDFTGWELRFKGERFILPIKEPQASKDNTTRNSIVNLTFYSWATYEMKRYYFMSLSEVSTGVAIPNKYNASVILPVESFVELFNNVLSYYFGTSIRMELFGVGTGIYSTNPVVVEINYSYIWDVLQKFYELFGLRWNIVYDQSTSAYVIKVNFTADAITDHDFEYGYDGGLLRFERQVQDDNINNIMLGRGGEKNLPYRYFKREDPQNEIWTADPDAIYELRNIYFDRLRDVNFRWYVRGWMQNPNRDTTWEQGGYVYPTYVIDEDSPYYFAYYRGMTDEKFNPVEFVKDDQSIEKYGERWGALDDNDEIYPTIQGVERAPIGRVDEVVAVSEIESDDMDAAARENVTSRNVGGTINVTRAFSANETKTDVLQSDEFSIPSGSTGNLIPNWLSPADKYGQGVPLILLDTSITRIVVVDTTTGVERSPAGIPAGTYRAKITLVATNEDAYTGYSDVTYGLNSLSLSVSELSSEAWKPTFDIWVKNIWETSQGQDESDAAYATRVWEKILGDRVGNEAKVVFSDGFMSISEDYEFTIASYPAVDRSKSINGVQSEWKITLYKSDAEFDATGKYIPSATGGKPIAGDHFFFIGIDMPFLYVIWAEENINSFKQDELDGVKDINPTWVIKLDKVRCNTHEGTEYGEHLADRLSAGATIQIRDARFTGGDVLTLYVQSITYMWNEPTQNSPYLVPDIEVVLSDKVLSVQSPVAKLSSEVSVIRSTYARTEDVESVVRKVGNALYLKKTGESDNSDSPTTFASRVASKSFRQGDIGGDGWGYYEDNDGDATLELDKLVVRKEMRVNSLVANQVSYVGGKQIISAASIECTQVVETSGSYVCYFDQRRGSVANLFQVGDIALGQVFDESNAEVRYYRCVITAVDVNNITLSKTQKSGSGVPQKGDVIIQYGNTGVESRQYVIVRDIIGGGYEQMISGLDSVSANGTEYYFAGRQNGSAERWFVGNRSDGQYVEYANGRLTLAGALDVTDASGSTLISGNFIQSGALQLGSIDNNDEFTIWSGLSGLYDSNNIGGGIAAWFGGPRTDYAGLTEAQRLTTPYAKSLFRFDGSGYLAGNRIYWDANGYGGIPGITWDGTRVKISSDLQFQTGDNTYDSLLNAMRDFVGYFERVNVGTEQNPVYAIHVKSNMGLVVDGFGSFGGTNPGGGGGGIGISEMWQSLMNEAYPAHYNDKIHTGHIPIDSSTIVVSGDYIALSPTLASKINNAIIGDAYGTGAVAPVKIYAVKGDYPTILEANAFYFKVEEANNNNNAS